MTAQVYLILAIVSSAAMTIVLKVFPPQKGNRYGLILGNYLTCILLAFITLPDRSVIFRIDSTTLLLGIIGGVLFVIGLLFLQNSIRYNGAILSSAFSKMGLIVPLTLSIVFWGETPGVYQITGIVLVLISIVILNGNNKKEKETVTGISLFWLIGVLIAFGSGDSMAKVFEQLGERENDSLYFLIVFFTAAILTTILLFYERHKTGTKVVLKEVIAGVLVGIPNYFSSVLLLNALIGLPAIIVYPCYATGTILLVTLVSAAFLKERLDRRKIIGLIVILIAVILLNV